MESSLYLRWQGDKMSKKRTESSQHLPLQRYVKKKSNGIQSISKLAEICNKENIMESSLYLHWQRDEMREKRIESSLHLPRRDM